jgi:hypothetical protein
LPDKCHYGYDENPKSPERLVCVIARLLDFHLSQSEHLIQTIREEFRSHLEKFYTHIHLAPPYHSIEKALQLLSNTLRAKPEHLRQTIANDHTLKWEMFQEAFVSSGLNRKHRGIILNFAKNPLLSKHSHESLQFLKNFSD